MSTLSEAHKSGNMAEVTRTLTKEQWAIVMEALDDNKQQLIDSCFEDDDAQANLDAVVEVMSILDEGLGLLESHEEE